MCTIHAQFCAHVVHLHNRIDSAQTVDACYSVVGVVCYRIGVVVVFSARHPAYSSSVCTLHIYLYEYVLRSFLSHRITQPQRGIYIYIYMAGLFFIEQYGQSAAVASVYSDSGHTKRRQEIEKKDFV